MMPKHLFQTHQNKAIEDNYSSNPVFRLLNFVCAPIEAEAKEFALKSGELFYNCVYSLDALKGKSYHELKEKCTLLWAEIVSYLKSKSLTIENDEVFMEAALMAYSVSRCLLVSKISSFIYPSEIISNYLTELNPKVADTLRKRFNRALDIIHEKDVEDWIKEYINSDNLLSNEIGDLIDSNRSLFTNLNVEDAYLQPQESQDVIILNAIYNISQEKDTNDKPLMRFKADWIAVFAVLVQLKKVTETQYREGALIFRKALSSSEYTNIPSEEDLSKKSNVIHGILIGKATADLKQSKLDHYNAIMNKFKEFMK